MTTKDIIQKGAENRLQRRMTTDPLLRETKTVAEIVASRLVADAVADFERSLEATIKDITASFTAQLTQAVAEIELQKGDPGQDASPEEVAQKLLAMPSFVAMLKGDKGDPGKTPTKKELLAIIKPLIPTVTDGHTPTEAELLALITPFIPKVKDGKTPTKKQLLKLIKPLIPKPDETLVEQIAELQKKLALVAKRKQISGGGMSLVAGSGITITRQTGGRYLVSALGTQTETPVGTVNGVNTTFTVTNPPRFLLIDGMIRVAGYGYTYSSGTIETDPLTPPVQYITAFF